MTHIPSWRLTFLVLTHRLPVFLYMTSIEPLLDTALDTVGHLQMGASNLGYPSVSLGKLLLLFRIAQH